MIRSCKDKETKKVLSRERSRKFQAIERQARIKLELLNAAASLQDLSLPGLALERLFGDREDQYSIRINSQYRICFW